jgi:dipeptide transport system ATP-binding protein
LLQAVPERSRSARRLNTLGGMVPGQHDRPQGCLLEPRCPSRQEKCRTQQPLLTGAGATQVRCFYPMDVVASV